LALVPNVTPSVGARVELLRVRLTAVWAALPRNGNPNHAGLPNRPAYTVGKRATMIFDVPCRVEDDPTEEVREIMEHRTA
jgi:para-nitrobenzyl esterase